METEEESGAKEEAGEEKEAGEGMPGPVEEDLEKKLKWFLMTNSFTRKKTKYLVTAMMFLLVMFICLPLLATGLSEYTEGVSNANHAREQSDLCEKENLTRLGDLTCVEWKEKVEEEDSRASDALARAFIGAGGLSISLLVAMGLLVTHIKTSSIVRERRTQVRSLVDKLGREEVTPVAGLAELLEMRAEVVERLVRDLTQAKILNCEIKDAMVISRPLEVEEKEEAGEGS